jgi:hypothetical protein
MIRRLQIRGFAEEVLFAERHGDKDKVFKLHLNDKQDHEIEKTELFTHHEHIVSMQRAAENSPDNKFQHFYILDADLQVHGITTREDNQQLVSVCSYDFSGYRLDSLIHSDWASAFMSKRSLTFEDIVYRSNDHD